MEVVAVKSEQTRAGHLVDGAPTAHQTATLTYEPPSGLLLSVPYIKAPFVLYSHPGEHWVRRRTTNRVDLLDGAAAVGQVSRLSCGGDGDGFFKPAQSAQTDRRAVNAPQLIALVCAGAVVRNGELLERPDDEREAA